MNMHACYYEIILVTYGGDERSIECILTEPEEDTSLAHSRVSDQQQFEEIIICLSHDSVLLCCQILMKCVSQTNSPK